MNRDSICWIKKLSRFYLDRTHLQSFLSGPTHFMTESVPSDVSIVSEKELMFLIYKNSLQKSKSRPEEIESH